MKAKFIFLSFILLGIFSCKNPEARRPIKHKSGSYISKSVERNKAIFEKQEKQIVSILEKNKQQPYYFSDTGFWYYYNSKDTLQAPKPSIGDKVIFEYDVKDLNGNTIYTKDEIGLQNYWVDQSNQDLISGIRDGIKLMKEGETVTFLFPSHKAYGYYGIKNKLGTNVPIQCTITLNSINQKNENN